MNEDVLHRLRDEIDEIDKEILATLKRRSSVVAKVGDYKRANNPDSCFLRPSREAVMIKRLIHADVGEFPNEHLYAIWRLLIAASTSIEQTLTCSVLENGNGLYLAREYFGPTAPIKIRKTEAEIVADIKNRKCLIGFMPHPEHSKDQWWLDLQGEDAPKLFAIAPQIADNKVPNAFLIGYVKPENSGDNRSWILSESNVTAGKLIAKNLYEISGFSNEANCIGSYAVQI